MTAPAVLAPARLQSAHRAVLVIFALAGVTFASWASRIADAKHSLGLTPGQLGATLLALSVGSVMGLPSSGRVAGRIGAANTIRIGLGLALAGLVIVGVGVDLAQSRWVLAPGLFLVGLGVGFWDVSMNLEGATVERMLGRTTMPHYHAAFSAGTVISAFFGAAATWQGISILAHLAVTGTVVVGLGFWQLRFFLPTMVGADADPTEDRASAAAPARSAWLERRTLLVGVVVLAAAFAEGTANDWLSVAFVDGHDLPTWVGVLGFAVFLTFMTVGRLLGTRLLDRRGRVVVVRATFVLATLGSLAVVYGPVWLGYAGAAVWGVGASLGFPVGMSASADDPARAAARMSTVATIGYTAFLAGPPLLGFLGDHFGVLHSLLAVTALTVLASFVVPVIRQPQPAVPLMANTTA